MNHTALDLKLHLSPHYILTDFEDAAINSFKFHFPSAILKGCFFHFSQCLWRKFAFYGFTVHYSNKQVKSLFKSAIALALLPQDKVKDAFEMIVDVANDINVDHDIDLTCFVDYMTDTWIDYMMQYQNLTNNYL